MNSNEDITTDNSLHEAKTSYLEACFSFFASSDLASRVFQLSGCRFNRNYRANSYFKNGTLDEFNILSKLKNKKDQNLATSKYEKQNESTYLNTLTLTDEYRIFDDNILEKHLSDEITVKIEFSASVKELVRRLALYTGQVLSTLFRVLRNTRIHSLSIFFGLCCSRSGYIFEAIAGTSSHPVPASL